MDQMLVQSYDALGIAVIKTIIEHWMAGTKCFTVVQFGKRTVLGY